MDPPLWRKLLETEGFVRGPVFSAAGETLPSIRVKRTDVLLELQSRIVEGTRPFAMPGGFASAFLVTPKEAERAKRTGEPAITDATVAWVKNYLSDAAASSGFSPHITVGLADDAGWAELSASRSDNMGFDATAVVVCHLGNFGTCHSVLRTVAPDVEPDVEPE